MDKELLQRYVEGNVTAKEVEIVVDWLDSDNANVREFMTLHKLYDISLLNKPALIKHQSKKTIRRSFRKITFELIKIAAVFLVVWFGIRFLNHQQTEPEYTIAYQTLIVPAGQRAELILPDSSIVWLNAKSQIVYPTNFDKGNREIQLEGEAYFKVTHNPQQPFIVKIKDINIKVLGTEFNVQAYAASNTQISLLKGCIELETKGISGKYTMQPTEQAKLCNQELHISKISQYEYFKWKDGILFFYNESVESIMNKLQLYYNVNILINKKDLLSYHYTGKFRIDDGVEQVLKVLQLEHKFTYTRDKESNVITIN